MTDILTSRPVMFSSFIEALFLGLLLVFKFLCFEKLRTLLNGDLSQRYRVTKTTLRFGKITLKVRM